MTPRAEMTFAEIGAALGVSHQRAQQIFDRAMKKMRRRAGRGQAESILHDIDLAHLRPVLPNPHKWRGHGPDA